MKLGLLARTSRTTPTPARTMPPFHLHSQARSLSDAATPSGSLADDERDEAAAPPGWPARASRWPVQRGGTGSPILARALADARRSRERAKCGKIALFADPSRRLHVGTSRIDDSPPAPACAPCNSIQNRHVVRLLNRSWRGATAILHLCSTTSYIVRRRRTRSSNRFAAGAVGIITAQRRCATRASGRLSTR